MGVFSLDFLHRRNEELGFRLPQAKQFRERKGRPITKALQEIQSEEGARATLKALMQEVYLGGSERLY